jgi:hypothetical protein
MYSLMHKAIYLVFTWLIAMRHQGDISILEPAFNDKGRCKGKVKVKVK